MNNHDVARAFVRGEKEAQGSHMFIENGVLYSYGHHFPMAMHKGNKIVVNIDRYSNSTSKHQSYLRREICGQTLEVNTAVLKRAVEGEKVDIDFKKVSKTATAKAIVMELEKLGFTPRDGGWDRALYGNMPVVIQWRNEYTPNSSAVNMGVSLHVEAGKWIGRMEAKRGKIVEINLNIADAILA